MIWVIGSKGMLGQELTKQLEEKSIAWVGSDSEVDITNPEALDDFAESHDRSANRTGSTAAKGFVPQKITWVVNCAAYTKVDEAEENQELAQKLNAQGALNIARATRKIGASLSTFQPTMFLTVRPTCLTRKMPLRPRYAFMAAQKARART